MRSCKYVKVTQQEKRHTKILWLRNLRFFNNGRLVFHDDPNLEYSNCINITFEMQKKDEKNNTTTHMALGDITLCPVRAAAQPSSVGSYRTREPTTTPQSPISGNMTTSNTSCLSKSQMRCKMPSWQLGRTLSTLPKTRSEHTPSARKQQWPCSLAVAPFSSSR
jgi:hypothetical protein